MRTAIRVAAAAAVAGAAVATAASPAFASASSPAGASRTGHAVFVQTDNTAGNRVVAYDRAADGTLTPVGSYATGQVAFTPDGSQLVVMFPSRSRRCPD